MGGLGSSQIFRSLIAAAPCTTGTLVYGVSQPPPWDGGREIFIRERLHLGRIERSRLAGMAKFTRILTWQYSRRKMHRAISTWQPDHVHAHIHGTGFIHAVDWCQLHRVPFSVCVHDDIRHLALEDPWKNFIEKRAAEAWRAAANRFVISPEIAAEYSQRYGKRDWLQVTDGIQHFPRGPRQEVPGRWNLYFAGGMNVPYEPNFLAVQQALKKLGTSSGAIQPRFILRGGRKLAGEDSSAPPLEPLPFGSQEDVARDMDEADVLYLPLSIDSAFQNFAKFSLSTKMVGFLASGLPIFYHGPAESAVYRLLSQYNACAACFTNDPEEILHAILTAKKRRAEIAANAVLLGRERFQLSDIQKKFWSKIQGAILKQ